MKDSQCVQFLQTVLPQLRLRWLGFRKVRRQVCKRVDRRLRQLALEDVEQYRAYLADHPTEWHVLDTFCRISISRFYRDRGVFDLLREAVLPELAEAATRRGDGRILVWSAGCASGEEVYTVKSVWELDVGRRFPGLSLGITATDVDAQLLERARRGCYPGSSVKDFPAEWLTETFLPTGDEFCVRDGFRDGIEFLCQDIRHQQPAGPFDLILCRHFAFTYFDESLQEDVLRAMTFRMRPGAMLVSGKQEALPGLPDGELYLVQPHAGVYRLAS